MIKNYVQFCVNKFSVGHTNIRAQWFMLILSFRYSWWFVHGSIALRFPKGFWNFSLLRFDNSISISTWTEWNIFVCLLARSLAQKSNCKVMCVYCILCCYCWYISMLTLAQCINSSNRANVYICASVLFISIHLNLRMSFARSRSLALSLSHTCAYFISRIELHIHNPTCIKMYKM